MASYGTLCAWAEQMGHEEASKLLRQTEEEETAADEKLTEVQEMIANERVPGRIANAHKNKSKSPPQIKNRD